MQKLTNFCRLKNKFFVFLFTIMPLPLFARDILPAGMMTLAENIQEIFTGPIVRTILIMCLCGTAIAYGVNKDNERMKKGIIAIFIAIVLLIGAQAIVGAVWDAARG